VDFQKQHTMLTCRGDTASRPQTHGLEIHHNTSSNSNITNERRTSAIQLTTGQKHVSSSSSAIFSSSFPLQLTENEKVNCR